MKYIVTMEVEISDDLVAECYNRMIFSSKNPSDQEIEERIKTYMENGIVDIISIKAERQAT